MTKIRYRVDRYNKELKVWQTVVQAMKVESSVRAELFSRREANPHLSYRFVTITTTEEYEE